MTIVVNTEPREVPEGLSVAGLLAQLGVSSQPCAVEVNLKLVPKLRHPTEKLNPGDKVEIVTLVGGG